MTPEDVQRILEWPQETRLVEEVDRLVEYRAAVHREMYELVDNAERFDRALTAEEHDRYQALDAEYLRLSSEVPSRR